MVFKSGHKCFTVVSSAEDEYSSGKTKKLYCKKNDLLLVVSDRDNVLIVYGSNGFFPILTSNTKTVMIDTPDKLINTIKTVDLKMSHCFPTEFVVGITENKPWENEFVEALKSSDVRASLKREILGRYEAQMGKQ